MILYFDLLDTLEDYTTSEVGELILAMMRYAKDGEMPEFQDRSMRTVWRVLQQKADADDERFESKVVQARYARWCGTVRDILAKKGLDKQQIDDVIPSREEWEALLPPGKSSEVKPPDPKEWADVLTGADVGQRTSTATTTCTYSPSSIISSNIKSIFNPNPNNTFNSLSEDRKTGREKEGVGERGKPNTDFGIISPSSLELYRPLTEDQFMRQKEAAIKMLENYDERRRQNA